MCVCVCMCVCVHVCTFIRWSISPCGMTSVVSSSKYTLIPADTSLYATTLNHSPLNKTSILFVVHILLLHAANQHTHKRLAIDAHTSSRVIGRVTITYFELLGRRGNILASADIGRDLFALRWRWDDVVCENE